ncbi:hypothetical protein Holit_00030 [Hollandina sp. SP2]
MAPGAALYGAYTAYTDDAHAGEAPALPLDREFLDHYNKRLKLYAMEEWETAGPYFSHILSINKADYLSRLYLERIAQRSSA